LNMLTANEAIRLLHRGEISSRELTQEVLKQIERAEPAVHAFLTVVAEQALAEAEQADKRLAQARRNGDEIPPLLGLPIAVKDVLITKGIRTTAGSRILENFVPPFDATSVRRVKEAGAIIVGKTNTDEFAMGSSTENSAFGVTHNPWDLERVPGGSSGGSAAAVAARMVPVALGTDTGGSVRQPAAFCGVTGLKTTYGRISRYGLIAYGSSLDTVGVLSQDAADAALFLHIMAGRDPLDATSVDAPIPPAELRARDDLHGLKIGVPREYFGGGIQPEVEKAVRAALDIFADMGAEITEISLPHTEYAVPVYYLIAPAEASANLARFDGIRYGPRVPADSMWDVFRRTRGQLFGPEVKRRIMLGTYALSAGYYDAYYGKAQKVRTLIKRDFETAYETVDLIAAPVAPSTAFKIGEHTNDPLAMYLEDVFTLPANLAGVPGVSFPVGFDRVGLPIGMQLMGAHFQEHLILEVVHTYQQATDWHRHQPDPLGDDEE